MRIRWSGTLCLAVALGAGSIDVARGAESPTSAPATAPAEEKKPEPRCKLTDLFRVDLNQRRLDVLFTPPAFVARVAGASSGSVLTEGASDDRWYLDVAPVDRRGDGSFKVFQASCDDRLDDRYASLRLTMVNRGEDDAISIAGAGRVDSLWVLVNLTQDPGGGTVHFSVQRPRRRMRPIHEFQAADLLTLWSEHPKELRQFLFPLLREMCGKNVLAPRAGDVYRAFAAIPADPQVAQKLAAILPALDADAPSERDAAAKQLNALGPPGVLAALRVDPSTLTPEQRARLDTLVQDHSTTADPAALARHDPYFLVDCLGDSDVNVRSAALEALRSVTGKPTLAFDVAASEEERARAAAALAENLDDAASNAGGDGSPVPAAGFNP
jgi:hypothetical protein